MNLLDDRQKKLLERITDRARLGYSQRLSAADVKLLAHAHHQFQVALSFQQEQIERQQEQIEVLSANQKRKRSHKRG